MVTYFAFFQKCERIQIFFENVVYFHCNFSVKKSLSGTLGLELRARAGFGLCGLKKFGLGYLRACQKVLRAGRAFGLGLP